MSFDGVVEFFDSNRIVGWVSCVHENSQLTSDDLTINLRFHKSGSLGATKVVHRSPKNIGFTFVLPKKFQEMSWSEFLEDFDGVFAFQKTSPSERWRIPFYKSVFGGFDRSNKTTLVADRLKAYSIEPKPSGRIAALTIVFNEHRILPFWAKYYAGVVGAENVFILDQGSSEPYTNLPDGVTIIRLPRDTFDNWLIMRLVATFQRHLLESYDAVLYSDSDEFLCVDPDVLGQKNVKEFLLSLSEPVGIVKGYNLHHDILREPALDFDRPIVPQRRYITREPAMDKPMISRIPLDWVPGFHSARQGGKEIDGMYMLHLRWYDLDSALIKGGNYRNSKWDPYDVQKDLATYQRASENDIVSQFHRRAELFATVNHSKFEPSSETTILPDWMRTAVWI